MTTTELLAKVEMRPVSKARNLREIGWADELPPSKPQPAPGFNPYDVPFIYD